MSDRLKMHRDRYFVPATFMGPRPSDFPVGSVQSRAAARAIVVAHAEEQREEDEAELAKLSPAAQANIINQNIENPLLRRWMINFALLAENREKVFERETPFFTVERNRHDQEVAEGVDRLAGGKGSSLRNGDHREWNRLRVIAEKNLLANKK
jgi:hypothetical protein